MSNVIHDTPADNSPDTPADGERGVSDMTVGPRPDSATRKGLPPIVIPTNKVTVALPFSKITVQEPGQELAELAAIVAELATLVETVAAEPEATRLRLRAQALAARVR